MPKGRLPHFVIIGAMRAGTTTVWDHLRRHPDVFMPYIKEPNFFVDGVNWDRGFDWYESLFADAKPGQLLGEASTGYTNFPRYGGVPKLLAEHIPDVKLIYLVRHPVERMKSAWVLMRSEYHEWRPLTEALLSDIFYITQSQYAAQIAQYLQYFSRESILLLRYEDLSADLSGAMTKICEFLGIDATKIRLADEPINSSSSKLLPRRRMRLIESSFARAGLQAQAQRLRAHPIAGLTHKPFSREELRLSEEVRDRLLDYLSCDVRAFRELVGPSMDLWGLA